VTALYGAWIDAAGEPCVGQIVLTPRDVRGSVLDTTSMVGLTRIALTLDEYGEIDTDIDPGDYRVDIRLLNAETVSREISVPWADSIDLRGLLTEYEPAPSEAFADFGQGYYTYALPYWAQYVDIVLLGGGGGGDDGVTLSNGKGGDHGNWQVATLERGVDIPWESTSITGYVGAGGAHNEGNGEVTTAAATGMTELSAAGGAGGASGNFHGLSPGNRTLNYKLYQGGGEVSSFGDDGEAPGGGGAGGAALNGDAGAGAAGHAWFRAYRSIAGS